LTGTPSARLPRREWVAARVVKSPQYGKRKPLHLIGLLWINPMQRDAVWGAELIQKWERNRQVIDVAGCIGRNRIKVRAGGGDIGAQCQFQPERRHAIVLPT
jgi:hypothetical protein